MTDFAPPRGLLASDEDESDEFISAIGALLVNDALLILAGTVVEPEAEPHLKRALAILLDHGAVERSQLRPGQTLRPEGMTLKPVLSANAVDRIVEQKLREAQTPPRRGGGVRQRLGDAIGVLDPDLQRAVALMIEALAFLDRGGGGASTPHLQLAIDRAMGERDGGASWSLSIPPGDGALN